MNDMKNIVVLKNLPSNLIEEAIVILKTNKKVKKLEYIEQKKENEIVNKKKQNNPKEYMIKEAEFVIHNYISNIEKQKQNKYKDKNIEQRYKRLKKVSLFLCCIIILNIILKFI